MQKITESRRRQALWHTILGWHRPLMTLVAGMVLLSLVSAAGLVFDDRSLVGAPIWLKPLKFAASVAIYGFTLAWLHSLQHKARRWGWWMGTVISITMMIEMTIVTGQVLRGRLSHFNVEKDPVNQFIQPIFGHTIEIMFGALLIFAVLLAFQRIGDRAMSLAIRLGLGLAMVGMALGILMFANVKPDQLAAKKAGAATVMGGHSVGVADGGPGLPITGWSTTGGDLRIPHFVGIHALQVLPLLALALAAAAGRWTRLRHERTRSGLVWVAFGAYAGLLTLLTWQALRGQPLLQPDATTLAAAAALLTATIAGLTTVLTALPRHGANQPAPSPDDTLANSVDLVEPSLR
jgi:hypothetical protein